MSGVFPEDLYIVLLEMYAMAQAQIELIETGRDPMDVHRLAVLRKMVEDLARIVRPEQTPLH